MFTICLFINKICCYDDRFNTKYTQKKLWCKGHNLVDYYSFEISNLIGVILSVKLSSFVVINWFRFRTFDFIIILLCVEYFIILYKY